MATAPIIVEKIAKNARSFSAARRPGIQGNDSPLILDELPNDRSLHPLLGPRQFRRKRCHGHPRAA